MKRKENGKKIKIKRTKGIQQIKRNYAIEKLKREKIKQYYKIPTNDT